MSSECPGEHKIVRGYFINIPVLKKVFKGRLQKECLQGHENVWAHVKYIFGDSNFANKM